MIGLCGISGKGKTSIALDYDYFSPNSESMLVCIVIVHDYCQIYTIESR